MSLSNILFVNTVHFCGLVAGSLSLHSLSESLPLCTLGKAWTQVLPHWCSVEAALGIQCLACGRFSPVHGVEIIYLRLFLVQGHPKVHGGGGALLTWQLYFIKLMVGGPAGGPAGETV